MKNIMRDLAVAFVWSVIVSLIICAPGVFTHTLDFVYTVF
jgi:hypothetical protein